MGVDEVGKGLNQAWDGQVLRKALIIFRGVTYCNLRNTKCVVGELVMKGWIRAGRSVSPKGASPELSSFCRISRLAPMSQDSRRARNAIQLA